MPVDKTGLIIYLVPRGGGGGGVGGSDLPGLDRAVEAVVEVDVAGPVNVNTWWLRAFARPATRGPAMHPRTEDGMESRRADVRTDRATKEMRCGWIRQG